MKISILLPYKENFSPNYPGAVSLFVYETSKKVFLQKKYYSLWKYKLKKVFPIKYTNISLLNIPLTSQTRNYVNKFIKLKKKKIHQ